MERGRAATYSTGSFQPWSVSVQDLIWIGIAVGLALLGLWYVSLADRA